MAGWLGKKYATIIASLLLGNLIFLAIFGARTWGVLESSELTTYDYFIRIKPEIVDNFIKENGMEGSPRRRVEDEIVFQNTYKLNTTYYILNTN